MYQNSVTTNYEPKPRACLEELVRRARKVQSEQPEETAEAAAARVSLEPFIRYTTPWWRPARHLSVLCHALDMVVDGTLDRLMVSMPVRNGKSEVVSVPFPAYYLGRFPDRSVIHTSYADALSQKFSRRVRAMIRGNPEYQRLFPTIALSSEHSSVQEWELGPPHRGLFKSGGMATGVTGHGGELIILDDPIKGREAADSPVQRERVMETWRNDLLTRLHPGGAIVGTMSRWHPQDWHGQVIAEALADAGIEDIEHAPWHPDLPEARQVGDWAVLTLPALAEEHDPLGRQPGEPLWPERWSLEQLERIRREMADERGWYALYQQKPITDTGNMFKAEYFAERWDRLPVDVVRVITFWDGAAKAGQTNDEWAACTLAVGRNGLMYLLNVTADRMTAPEAEEVVVRIHRAMVRKWGDKYEDYYEDASGMVAVAQYLPNSHPNVALIPVSTGTKDLVEHANSVLKWFKAHRVLFPAQHLPWIQPTINQMLPFPLVEHDDRVCAVVKAVQVAVASWEAVPTDGDTDDAGPIW
jgi:predicted phage terminase large subunit-like protein